jgi:bifunctional DNA-binding transcriptional regulator/antitoxin component of YhaV-PrlF toxin-antitoxin module
MSNNIKGISKIWLTNKISATLIIPKEIALRNGLNDDSRVVVEQTDKGILIRKLEI